MNERVARRRIDGEPFLVAFAGEDRIVDVVSNSPDVTVLRVHRVKQQS